MSTESWEERMAARAGKRERDRQAVAAAAEAARRAVEEQETAEAARAEFEAGPPDGCGVCYQWSECTPYFGWSPSWVHFTIEDGDETCYHDCHSEPLWCGLILMAAPG